MPKQRPSRTDSTHLMTMTTTTTMMMTMMKLMTTTTATTSTTTTYVSTSTTTISTTTTIESSVSTTTNSSWSRLYCQGPNDCPRGNISRHFALAEECTIDQSTFCEYNTHDYIDIINYDPNDQYQFHHTEEDLLKIGNICIKKKIKNSNRTLYLINLKF